MQSIEFHPIASVFPLMPDDELQSLAADIAENGLLEPITKYEGMVLDGRNRLAACRIAGVEPRFVEFTGDRREALSHSWSLNFARRSLNSSQKAIADSKRAKLDSEYADEIQRLKDEAKAKLSEAGRKSAPGRPAEKPRQQIADVSADDRKVTSQRAKSAGTNRTYIQESDRILEERPDLAERIESGAMTIPQAKTVMRQEQRQEQLQTMPWPEGKYRVVYADPPWSYNDKRTGTAESGGVVAQYDTMSLDAICKLDVKSLSMPDSVLFLWATSPLLPEALTVLESWGFKYKSSFVWDKLRGFNGHYNDVRHEFLLIGVRGSCTPDVAELKPSVVQEKRGRHSAKPESFREIIDYLYPHGPRVELFSRRHVEGWSTWGNEVVSNG